MRTYPQVLGALSQRPLYPLQHVSCYKWVSQLTNRLYFGDTSSNNAARTSNRRLSIIFIISSLAGIIGFVKVGTGLAAGVAVGNQYLMGIWASVQMGLSIVCCCVITFKPILAKFSIWTSTLTSKTSLLFSWRPTQGFPQSTTAQNSKDLTWIRVEDSSDCLAFNTYRSEVV